MQSSHPERSKLEGNLAKYIAGHNGEKSLQYFYRYLPKQEANIIQNILIKHMEFFFQIDTLIITSKFLILLEIKNYTGDLFFDDKYGQLIRTSSKGREIFEDPIQQAKRQSFHLTQVLEQHKIPKIPIETLVVITNPRTFVDSSESYKNALKLVIKSPMLLSKYEEFNAQYKKDVLFMKERKKIKRLLMKLNEPYNPDILSYFGIDKSELITGVLCSKCNTQMNRINANWECAACFHTSKTAHIGALRDYALIISTDITNKECKDFLHLSTSMQAYYLLNSLSLPYTGTSRRTRTYHLDSLIT
ncbi:nuclease-related domain-containing protein [Fictibacillus nanhaiensis]|uniref:nuclease-related domain-containing protein n=1 Tax=Fictibacillus nanhaiensis TaxID=742169 RepID=UPI003C28C1AD